MSESDRYREFVGEFFPYTKDATQTDLKRVAACCDAFISRLGDAIDSVSSMPVGSFEDRLQRCLTFMHNLGGNGGKKD